MQDTQQLTPIQQKRELLKKYSMVAAPFVEAGHYETINEAIVKECYTNTTHLEFKTFKEWKKAGYSVKKGEKAFLVWGKPKEPKESEPKEESEDDRLFFPVAFLFSNAQVEPKKGESNNV